MDNLTLVSKEEYQGLEKTKDCIKKTYPFILKPKIVTIIVVLSILSAIFQLASAYYMASFSEKLQKKDGIRFLVAFFSYIAVLYIYKVYLNYALKENSEMLVDNLNNHWFNLDVQKQTKSASNFVASLNLGLHTTAEVTTLVFDDIIKNTICFCVFLIMLMNMRFAWQYLAWVLLHFVVFKIVFAKLRVLFVKYQEVSYKLNEKLYDNILNIWSIKYEGIEDETKKEFNEIFSEKATLEEQFNTDMIHYSKIVPFCLFLVIIGLVIYQFAHEKDRSKKIFILIIFFKLYESYFFLWWNIMELFKESYSMDNLCQLWEQEALKPSNVATGLDESITNIKFEKVKFE